MPAGIVAIKEEGTHTPAEGLLARFAQIRTIKPGQDLLEVAKIKMDIIIVDVQMPNFDAAEILRVLTQSQKNPLIMLFSSEQPPGELLRQFSKLSAIGTAQPKRKLRLAQVIRTLGLSQEAVARLLGVSARTVHRWLQGTRPRPRRELDQLTRIVEALYEAFPSAEAIRAYLNHPNPTLDQDCPLDLLSRGEFERVAADLQAIEEGVYIQLILPKDLPRAPFSSAVHRVVKAGVDPLSMAGSLKAGGRYNDAGEFGALYASLDASTAAGEVARGLKLRGVDPLSFPEGTWWVYEIGASLEGVLDLTDPAILAKIGVTEDQLTGSDLQITRDVGNQARRLGYQGLLVPSAARNGEKNLVIFGDRLHQPLRVIRSESVLLAD